MMRFLKMYSDGGVIKSNPSYIGGTFAFCFVNPETRRKIKSFSGVVTPEDFNMPTVSSNLTEMWAIIRGLRATDKNDVLKVCSDSEISLGRVFMGYAMNGLPEWMREALNKEKRRFTYWEQFTYQQLSGHPTQIELKNGMSKEGRPVSKWNVYVDNLCTMRAKEVMNQTDDGYGKYLIENRI